MQTIPSNTPISLLDFARTRSVEKSRCDGGDILPIGTVVRYSDQANPGREYAVTSTERKPMGQDCISLDGTKKSQISSNTLDGLNGWRRTGKTITAEEAAALPEKFEIHHTEQQAAAAKQRAQLEADRAAAQAEFDKRRPSWAKAVLVATEVIDDSDTMTDYFGHKTGETIILEWSKHTRDLFSEMRKAAAKHPKTAHLADAPAEAEHREKYSMGGGYYLKNGGRHWNGWKVSKKGLSYYTPATSASKPEGWAAHLITDQDDKAETLNQELHLSEIQETHHTRDGHALYVVQLTERVDRPTFQIVNNHAKSCGGYYSSYRRDGALPGFQFKTQESAQQFIDTASA